MVAEENECFNKKQTTLAISDRLTGWMLNKCEGCSLIYYVK